MSTSASTAAKLPVRSKLAYGLGTVAFGIKDHGFNTFLMLYYNQVIGLPAAWVGTTIMLAMLIDGIADPVIGHWSDGLRSRWGRRHPFMYAAALPLSLGYLLLWLPPEASQPVQLAWLLVTSVVVRVALSCYEIPSQSLLPEFTRDYNERTSIATYRSLFFAVGMVGMGVVSLKVFLKPTAEQAVGQLNAAGYVSYAWAAAIVMLFAVLVSALGTHNRIPTLGQPEATERHGFKDLLRGLKLMLGDRTYASVLLCAFFFALAGGLATNLGVYVGTYFWRINSEQLAVLAGSAVWGVILALITVQLSKRFGKKQTTMTLYGIALLAIILPVILALLGILPRGIDQIMPWLIGKNILLVMSVLAAIILATSMVADVAEHLQLKTGQRMEGLMFATLVMVQKAVSGIGVFISGMVISAIQFPEKADPATVDPAIVNQLAWIYVISIGVLCGLAIIALWFYPITKASHQRMREELEARKQTAVVASDPVIVQP